MLRWRIPLGAMLIGALVGLLWLDFHAQPPGTWFFLLVLTLSLAAAYEAVTLVEIGGYRPDAAVVYTGVLLVVASNSTALFWIEVSDARPLERLAWPLFAFSFAVLAAFVGELRRYAPGGRATGNLGVTILLIAYVGLLSSFVLQLRVLNGPREGIVALAALVIVVKLADIGAYTVGRLFGRHKMSPLVSPGKTIEGAAGAIAFACLGAWLAMRWLPLAIPLDVGQQPWSWLVFGPFVGVAGMAGDLAESLLKRDAGVKDSSTWLPGFGGLLDLLDSILFAAPVAYLCWLLGST